jgi:phosphoribosyl-ATP pyrophosphohydrolase
LDPQAEAIHLLLLASAINPQSNAIAIYSQKEALEISLKKLRSFAKLDLSEEAAALLYWPLVTLYSQVAQYA